MKLKKTYTTLTTIFTLLTIYEFIRYIFNTSNYFGLFYIIVNLFIIFLMFMLSINIKKTNTKIRLSKNIIIITLGLTSSFILEFILNNIFTYKDQSSEYINNIYISIKILKPIIYLIISGLSYLEYKNTKISNR